MQYQISNFNNTNINNLKYNPLNLSKHNSIIKMFLINEFLPYIGNIKLDSICDDFNER